MQYPSAIEVTQYNHPSRAGLHHFFADLLPSPPNSRHPHAKPLLVPKLHRYNLPYILPILIHHWPTISMPISKLTQQQMPAATSNSLKLRSTAKPPRSPRTPRSHNSSRSSSRCSSSNSASSPLSHRALLPLDPAEKSPRRFGRTPSLFPRQQHRLSFYSRYRSRVSYSLLVPADLFFYTRLLSPTSISPTPLLLIIPFVYVHPVSRLCHDITL